LSKPTLVNTLKSGKRGRPRKVPSEAWLKEAMAPARRITMSKIARLLGIHRHTLRYYMKQYGVYDRFCNISDDDLELLIQLYKRDRPNSGLAYVMGFLGSHGLRVKKSRVRRSLRKVDPLGQALWRHDAIDRRKYSVPRSQYLWHLDGYHKLIKWGFVIHGLVDGYCHTVCSSFLPL
jgi:hypothetical protein